MIQLQQVVKHYRDQPKPALNEISLKIGKGEFCLLTGPSGAGKSTLLRLLFCAERATRGEIWLNGENLEALRRNRHPYLRRNVGVVFQDFKLIDRMSVFDNVALALEVQGTSRSEVQMRTTAMLDQVSLLHKREQRSETLSGGEQQRVAIARALVADPLILLADEPTGNLDAERSGDIMALLLRANARGTTVVVATHDPYLLEKYHHRTVALRDGRIEEDRRFSLRPQEAHNDTAPPIAGYCDELDDKTLEEFSAYAG